MEIAELLRALQVKPLNRVPIKVGRHLDRARLDADFWGSERLAVLHHAPHLVEDIRSAGREGRNLERRFFAGRTRLLERATGLQLGVLAVLVCQQRLPDGACARRRPEPDFASVLVVDRIAVDRAETDIRPPDAEHAVVAVEDVVRLVAAKTVLGIYRKVTPCVVDRPSVRVAWVSDVVFAWEEEVGIFKQRKCRVHPLVVGAGQVRAVEPDRPHRKVVVAGGEPHFHLPDRAADVLRSASEVTRAAVLVLPDVPVDRRRRSRGVSGDSEVELDAARAPRSPERDIAELDRMIVVDERVSGRDLLRAPNLAADFGEHGHTDLFVFEDHRLPLLRCRLRRRAIETEIGVERRIRPGHRIRIRESVRREFEFGFHDRNRRAE